MQKDRTSVDGRCITRPFTTDAKIHVCSTHTGRSAAGICISNLWTHVYLRASWWPLRGFEQTMLLEIDYQELMNHSPGCVHP